MKNQPGTMKTIENHENPQGTMKTMKNQGRNKQKRHRQTLFVTDAGSQLRWEGAGQE